MALMLSTVKLFTTDDLRASDTIFEISHVLGHNRVESSNMSLLGISKTKTQKRRPKTLWTKTKTLWSKTKTPWTKTNSTVAAILRSTECEGLRGFQTNKIVHTFGIKENWSHVLK